MSFRRLNSHLQSLNWYVNLEHWRDGFSMLLPVSERQEHLGGEWHKGFPS